MSDSHAIEALNERMDAIEDIVNDVTEDVFEEVANLATQVTELKSNMTSVIGMFTQMNISLLQLQNSALEKGEN